jgi:hypothetical protein
VAVEAAPFAAITLVPRGLRAVAPPVAPPTVAHQVHTAVVMAMVVVVLAGSAEAYLVTTSVARFELSFPRI